MSKQVTCLNRLMQGHRILDFSIYPYPIVVFYEYCIGIVPVWKIRLGAGKRNDRDNDA